jgi:2-methylfumaryl-CoA hydratase
LIVHPTPRTLTVGDTALYTALYGSRFAATSSNPFAASLGLRGAWVDDLLVFHIVFGRTVADISLNAIANLGYAAGRFGAPVYAGDTLTARSTIIGAKANKDGRTGVVYVHTAADNQRGEAVLEYCRWVMVKKGDAAAAAPEAVVPELPDAVAVADLQIPAGLTLAAYDSALAGSPRLWDDYAPGECIDHRDGMTIEEADHMMATRLYQNTARVHFNQHLERSGRFGRRIVYGGHVISIARALSFNGLANAFRIVALNGGRHVAPTFAGDTVYAWTEVIAKHRLPRRDDVAALRLRTIATKDHGCVDFPGRLPDGSHDPSVVLELDYTVLMPSR